MDINSIVKNDFLAFDSELTLSQMIGKLRKEDKRAGLIFRKNKFLGLVERKKLLKTTIDTKAQKLSQFVIKTPILSYYADVNEAAKALFDSDADYLPVEKDKQIVGVVHALDVAKAALESLNGLSLSDVKLVKPSKVEKKNQLSTAIQIMREQSVDHVPVFEKGKLYGIISFRDIVRKYLNWSPKRDVSAKFNSSSRSARVDLAKLSNLPVENFSTNNNLVKIKTDAKLKLAISLLTKHNIRNLLVVDGQKYVGLLTVRNILGSLAKSKVTKDFNLKFVGLKKLKLSVHQEFALKRVAQFSAFKLQRKLPNEFDLTIHVRAQNKEGRKQVFNVNLKLERNGKLQTSEYESWDLEQAVHKAFSGLARVANKRNK